MSVIVNVGVLIWIIVVPFLVGMTIGAAVMMRAFSKDKKNEHNKDVSNIECKDNKPM